MGPRLISRGEASVNDHLHEHGDASMGPRLISRGEENFITPDRKQRA